MAARIPMITTTIISSMSVKPFAFFMVLLLLLGAVRGWTWYFGSQAWKSNRYATTGVCETAESLTEPPGPVRLGQEGNV